MIVCILWAAVPQVQELISSLIVLNALWLAQAGMNIGAKATAGVQQWSTATAAVHRVL
ncbi:hypothetical protein [Streptomyces griseoaurantiacus]|uniref:hypothetical protein n=1 Tax=Streptomyces griseoaurantiacus TaxID=68213 RepID=UPI00345F80C6